MNKTVLIILGGLVLGLIGAGGYLVLSQVTSKTKSPDVTAGLPTPTPVAKLLTWDDPAGFTLSYPEGLKVDKHDEDKDNYAHVEFTDTTHPGSLIVWVKDFPKGVADTTSWGKKMSTPSSAISFDTTLGGQPAQKILISRPEKSVIVGVVYDGVLWYIEAALTDETYWQSVFDAVVNSFTFKPLPTSVPSAGGSTESFEGSVDEEEVLE